MVKAETYREIKQRIEAAKDGFAQLDLGGMELAELPQEISSLTHLRFLNLSHNQFTEVPAEIGSLTKLRYLNLAHNELIKLSEEISSLTHLRFLNLSHNQFTKVPAEIGSLTRLCYLNLAHNGLIELSEEISSLTHLRFLNLSHNQLSNLAKIGSLHQILTLNLSYNQLINLPEEIGFLTQLRSLNLTRNKLTTLPEEIDSLTKLKTLDLSYNRLTVLPQAVATLKELRQLILPRNQLNQVSECIRDLERLMTLNLFSNKLTEIPDWIGNLKFLKVLAVGNNPIAELPESLAGLKLLKVLNLGDEAGGMPLHKLPSLIRQLTNLKELIAHHCKIETLPDWLFEMRDLMTLSLNNNSLTYLSPSIRNLSGLKRLDIANNSLVDLPLSFSHLNLEQFTLRGNPLNSELTAAYEQGTETVMQYLRSRAEGEVALNEAKLILVGEGEVGKSCLLGALRGDDWVEGRPTTHGIEIKPVLVSTLDSNAEIALNGWDFGGQRVYRPTHQLFFSESAIYLVVWKPREGSQQGFVKEWITLVKRREPDAKILVVATHGGPGQRQADIDQQELVDSFGSNTILGFFHVNSRPDTDDHCCTGITELKQAIAQIAVNLPEMGRTVPIKWQQVREILQSSEKPYLPYREVMSLCAEQGIDEQQAEVFIRISHRLGLLTHYHYDPILRDIVILKPDWLAKAISFVLDDKETRRRNGLVEFDYLSKLWSNPPFEGEEGYSQELHPRANARKK